MNPSKYIGFLSVCVLMGCDYIQSPSRAECEKGVEHIIKIKSQERAGKGLPGQAVDILAQTALSASGEKDEMIGACVEKANRATVNCWLDAKSEAEIKKCTD